MIYLDQNTEWRRNQSARLYIGPQGSVKVCMQITGHRNALIGRRNTDNSASGWAYSERKMAANHKT